MESLPQIGLATVTLVCGLGCGLLILIGGIAFVVLRFGVLDRLMGGVGAAVDAAGDLGDGLGISGLMGDDQPDEQVRGQRQRAYQRVLARAMADNGLEDAVRLDATNPMFYLELGTVYAALGTRVTVVEMLPQLMTGADDALSLRAASSCSAADSAVSATIAPTSTCIMWPSSKIAAR
mgnify:CR=1 FL=1